MVNTPQNPSIVAAQAVVEGLIAADITDVAYCPGSRNAPFAYVLSAYERKGLVNVHPFIEERGAGFWAVGAAKASGGGPVAVVTTSGTAVAELHPALEEARHQGLPVVAVTADRPFELLGVGASQATRQVGIFGPSVVTEMEVPALYDESDGEIGRDSSALSRKIAHRVLRCVSRARGMGGRPGPAHINVAFRDPLVPAAPVIPAAAGSMRPPALWKSSVAEGHRYEAGPYWDEVVDPTLRTVVVAGDGDPRSLSTGREIAEEAARRNIPIVAEPSSGMTDQPTWIPHMPWVLERIGAQIEQVIVLGRPTLSRQVLHLLARPDVRVIIVADHEEWPDLTGNATCVVPTLLRSNHDGTTGEAHSEEVPPLLGSDRGGQCESSREGRTSPQTEKARSASRPTEGRGRTCVEAEDSAMREPENGSDHHPEESAVSPWLDRCREVACEGELVVASHVALGALDHVSAVRAIWEESAGVDLWLGASNVIRAFDLAAASPGRSHVFSNRGLAGIDGTIASALGLQRMRRCPVRVVLGDLTFCYDLPSLGARPDAEQDIQLIVFDDNGGSIFASLEHGSHADLDTFARYFAIPQTVDVVEVAQACGWKSTHVETLEEFRRELSRPVTGRSLLHLSLPSPAPVFHSLRSLPSPAIP